jgi:hypothetical protein
MLIHDEGILTSHFMKSDKKERCEAIYVRSNSSLCNFTLIIPRKYFYGHENSFIYGLVAVTVLHIHACSLKLMSHILTKSFQIFTRKVEKSKRWAFTLTKLINHIKIIEFPRISQISDFHINFICDKQLNSAEFNVAKICFSWFRKRIWSMTKNFRYEFLQRNSHHRSAVAIFCIKSSFSFSCIKSSSCNQRRQ